MKKTITPILTLIAALLFVPALQAQLQTPLDVALRYMEKAPADWGLAPDDTKDLVLRDQVGSRHNNTTHLYFNQRYAGIEVYNAINGVHVKGGEVVFATNRFVPEVAAKINTTVPALTPFQAIEAAATELGVILDARLAQTAEEGDRYTFEGGNLANSPIPVQLVFQPTKKQGLRLAWDLSIDMASSADYWSLRVDALTGEVIGRQNWTVKCDFGAPDAHHHAHNCAHQAAAAPALPAAEALAMQNMQMQADGAVYNVFALPAESPIHGPRVIVSNPADTLASPFGWHDTNGEAGPEYTITRGNNAHAFLDLDNSDTPQGDEPDGGEDLIFDFPLDLNEEPQTYQEAAVTQLFYMNNMMHDITYAYGFDEQAGNFQQNNYSRGGVGNDYVLAQAQDGGGTNNANFATPPDGGNGRMQMYLWTGGGSIFSVNAPQPVAGGYEVQAASFGAPITEDPVTGDGLIADDGSPEGSLACNALINGDEMAGKVAIIDRGGCEFGLKALNAQNAGAIAAIICNFEDELVGMGGGAVGGQVTIPVVSMGLTDCQTIRQFSGQGLNVTFQVPADNGPEFIDGDLDNGIIAHEYGHGISNRLTGGPSAAGCLGNDEQMGEGWSDYFALISTVQPGENGELPRGIGTFALRQETTGPGIRRQRYSTDMSVNDQVYDDVKSTTAPHPLGEVWAAVTWDLYWAMVDQYGWDPDPVNGTGGNNMAIQLVMDGMKLQACSPGFEDGRDAIMAADMINYDGAHECLIWEVFARRGMGFFMDQGSSDNRNDNQQDFEARPECIQELKISKTVTPLIQPGDPVEVTLSIINHKGEPVSGVMIEDEIPAGLTYAPGSETGATATLGDGVVTFEVGELANGESMTITYTMDSDEGIFSTTQFIDDMENGDDNWFFLNLNPDGFDVWQISDLDAYSGENSWFVLNNEAENDQVFFLREQIEVTGEQPVMRFFHKYNTEIGFDGGLVEISLDDESWFRIPDKFIRGGYNSTLDYQTLVIPFLDAFSGNSGEGWVSSYIDLSEYAGQMVNIRFRFGSDAANVPLDGTPGWFVDDIELMDMVNYNGEACISSDQGDLACAAAREKGTIVDSQLPTRTQEELPADAVAVFPNPAQGQLHVALDLAGEEDAVISLVAMDGRRVMQQEVRLDGQYQMSTLNVSSLPAGMYFVRVESGSKAATRKVVIR